MAIVCKNEMVYEDIASILECKKTLVKELWKAGLIKEAKMKHFRYGDYPVFDREYILSNSKIINQQIKEFLIEKEIKKAENKRNGITKATATKKVNKQIRDNFDINYKTLTQKWYLVNDEIGTSFELAYWNMWLSRLAKKAQISNNHSCRDYYTLKNDVIKILNLENCSKLSFYQPEKHTKIHFRLCEDCYYNYKIFGGSIVEYVKDFGCCQECYYEEQENYYSLYFLEIIHPDIEEKFSFHIPYPIGEEFLPKIEELEKLDNNNHKENEGMFRFGRPIYSGNELIIFTEKTILKNINRLIKNMQHYTNIKSLVI